MAKLSFQVAGGDADRFRVIRYRGTEGLCQLYRFEIELVDDGTHDALNDLFGKSGAKLVVETASGKTFFGGILSRVERIGEGGDKGPVHTFYRVELVPKIWLLTQRYNSRIYQAKTVTQIVQDVLDKAFGDATLYDLSGVTETHAPREYCVQYRETDYNFICRLLEEEGIRWYFEQAESGHKLMLADGPSYPAIGGASPALPYRPPSGMAAKGESISAFRISREMRPGAVVLRDFTPENPLLDLTSKADSGRDLGLECYDFPGRFSAQSDGNTLAKLRAEEFDTGRQLAVGESDCPRLRPGKKFKLLEHPAATIKDQEYLITSVTHQGKASTSTVPSANGRDNVFTRQDITGLESVGMAKPDPKFDILKNFLIILGRLLKPGEPTANRSRTAFLYHGGRVSHDPAMAAAVQGASALSALTVPNLLEDEATSQLMNNDLAMYSCRFECMPATAFQYRPSRVTPWPVMRGAQTARIVGPAGQEIHTDKYGRVRVQFHWDRQGAEGGQPKLHGADSSCWIRVAQGWAGGQYGLMFLPRVGQEVIVDFLEGDPDQPIIVGRVYNNDHMPAYELPKEMTKSYIRTHSSKGGGGTNEIRFEDLKDKEQLLLHAQRDLHIRVGGAADGEERLTIAKIQHVIIGDEQRTQVKKHRSTDVGGKDALHVKESRSVVVDADVMEDFKANHGHKVAGEYFVKANKMIVEAPGGISFKVGGNFIAITTAGVFIKGTVVHVNGQGAAIPGTASMSAVAPAAPEEADKIEHGKDTRYNGDPLEPPVIQLPPGEKHWISFELKHKDDNTPVPGEYYEVISADGAFKIIGALDVNGSARRAVPAAGTYKISFPAIDAQEWEVSA